MKAVIFTPSVLYLRKMSINKFLVVPLRVLPLVGMGESLTLHLGTELLRCPTFLVDPFSPRFPSMTPEELLNSLAFEGVSPTLGFSTASFSGATGESAFSSLLELGKIDTLF